MPGLRILANEMAVYHDMSEESLDNALTQLFPTSTGKNKDDVSLLMEKYMMYKTSFMKHLQFDPKLKNHSKFSILSSNLSDSFPSCHERPRPTRDCLHLL